MKLRNPLNTLFFDFGLSNKVIIADVTKETARIMILAQRYFHLCRIPLLYLAVCGI